MEEIFQIGVIASTHGVRGEVKVFPTTDDPSRFGRLKEVLLDQGEGQSTLTIEGIKYFKQFVILKFKGIDTMDDAQKLRQKSLYVLRENAVRLKKDEYFIADLLEMKVYDTQDNLLGTVQDVLVTGANDVYVIEMTDGRELLLPAIRQCIHEIDVEAGRMCVSIMEGLLDL